MEFAFSLFSVFFRPSQADLGSAICVVGVYFPPRKKKNGKINYIFSVFIFWDFSLTLRFAFLRTRPIEWGKDAKEANKKPEISHIFA